MRNAAFIVVAVWLSSAGVSALRVLPPAGAMAQRSHWAQTNGPVVIDASRLAPQSASLELPERSDGWVVEVQTSGGFLGTTSKTTLSSTGEALCSTACRKNARRAALSAVAASVKAAISVAWSGPSHAPVSVCSDCITTQLSLWQRAADGHVQVFRAQWNSVSANSIDPAVRRLYADVLTAARE
jgi:hypothetical protein